MSTKSFDEIFRRAFTAADASTDLPVWKGKNYDVRVVRSVHHTGFDGQIVSPSIGMIASENGYSTPEAALEAAKKRIARDIDREQDASAAISKRVEIVRVSRNRWRTKIDGKMLPGYATTRGNAISKAVKAFYDAERLHGQWSGPQWREAEALDKRLEAATEHLLGS